MDSGNSNARARFGIAQNIGDMGDHPSFRVLSDEKLERVHDATAEILEAIGIKVPVAEVREMMADAGCLVEDDVVKIPRRLLEDSIDSAPSKFTVYNREGEEALHIGSQEVYTHTGYTTLEFFDVDTGERRDYTLDDLGLVARVADALPNVDIIGQPGSCRPSEENPIEVIEQLAVEALLTNTSKPLHILLSAGGETLIDCLEMAESIAVANGAKSLAEKPFVIPFLNPISPLLYNEETTEKLLIAADWGVPVLCGPAPMTGGTAPVTMAGAIAQTNAETVAGLVIAQVRRKGTPYILLPIPYPMDLRTGGFAGMSPERTLMQTATREMGHYYGVPVQGGGEIGGGRGILDAEVGWTQMMNTLTAMLSGATAGIRVGAGPNLESCVLADEMVGMLKVMMKGVEINDETLALDAIREVGPGGGTFLGHPHTWMHFREQWEPTLLYRGRYEEWEAAGSKSVRDLVKEKLSHIRATHHPKSIPDAAQKRISAIIERARSRVGATAPA